MRLRVSSLVAAASLAIVPLSALLGCNAVLGIESDRRLDTSYPDGGYDGCSDNTDCTQCTTEVQRCLCEGGDPATCEDKPPKVDCENLADDCMTCGCEDCPREYADCTANAGCRKIRDCIEEHACDLGGPGAQSCDSSDACGDVIDANGGAESPSNELFNRLANCSIEADCPCKDRSCTEQFGCADCGDCMSTCMCEGKSDAECNSQCTTPCSSDDNCEGCKDCLSDCLCHGDSKPQCQDQCDAEKCKSGEDCSTCPDCVSRCMCEGSSEPDCQDRCTVSSCSENDDCAGCPDCVSACMCLGQSEAECQDLCSCVFEVDGCVGCADCMAECRCNGYTDSDCALSCGTGSTCSAESGCTDCSTCVQACRCKGGTVAGCTRECGVTRNDNCTAGVSCAECGTCVTKCTCNGGAPRACMNECDLTVCPTGCDSCTSCMDECECNGSPPDACIKSCLGSSCAGLDLPACDDCSCRNCPEAFERCWEDAGCEDIAQCMEDTGCRGAPCFTADYCFEVVDFWGGVSEPSATLAEQLVICRDLSGCDCSNSVTPLPAD